ncbi:MAG: DUF1573 domain-containing protein [Betaproteobacteria bacterium]
MKAPVMSSIFWGLIALAVGMVGFGIYKADQRVAKPRYESQRPVAVAGALASQQPFHDFGQISMAAGKVAHRFRVWNTGATAVTINRLYTSCMCTEATLYTPSGRKGPFGMPGHGPLPAVHQVIGPGGMAEVAIVFDPAAHGPAGVGPTERVVTIRSDDGGQLDLRFVAMVKP